MPRYVVGRFMLQPLSGIAGWPSPLSRRLATALTSFNLAIQLERDRSTKTGHVKASRHCSFAIVLGGSNVKPWIVVRVGEQKRVSLAFAVYSTVYASCPAYTLRTTCYPKAYRP